MFKPNGRQTFFVLVFAGLIILSALATTAYVTFMLDASDSDGRAYKNVTFTDAVLTCEKEARADFGRGLAQLVVDSHSSRYENESFVYKIFLNAYTKKANGEQQEFFVTCFVKPGNGRISKFDVFENIKAKEGEVIKQGGDKFIEWPH